MNKPSTPAQYLYRYEDCSFNILLCFGKGEGYMNTRPYPDKYRVLKYTPKGVWIERYPYPTQEKRFILLSAKKQYARDTKLEALKDYIWRKKYQQEMLQIKLTYSRNNQQAAERLLESFNEQTRQT